MFSKIASSLRHIVTKLTKIKYNSSYVHNRGIYVNSHQKRTYIKQANSLVLTTPCASHAILEKNEIHLVAIA